MVIELKEGVYWVGAIDWTVRDLHGYIIPTGTTYNAYLVVDEKVALVDTVKHGFLDEMMMRIEKIIDPERIDYVISNHTEMDHSGVIPWVMKQAKNATVVATKKGEEGLKRYYKADWDFKTVGADDELSLGKKTLAFVPTPMLHWPDSMMSYLKEDKILLSNDAFGQHIASYERFDDEVDQNELMEHVRLYFANILMPFTQLITKKLDEVEKLKIPIEMIAPSHGVIWRKNPAGIIEEYKKLSKGETERRAIIVYDTMWHSTEKMATAIAEGIMDEGVKVDVMKLRSSHISEVVTKILGSGALVIGSPTLNNGVFPTVAGFMTYLEGLKPQVKKGAAFGSFGWAGGAVRKLQTQLEGMGIEPIEDGLEVKFLPDANDIKSCIEFGRLIGKSIKEEN